MNLNYGDKIEVYRNLHKKCFSVRHKGKVIYHLKDNEQLSLTNVKFVVQPAGHAKVLREKRKNVHAFVRGEFEGFKSSLEEDVYLKPFNKLDFSYVSYNPYKSNKFQVKMDGDMTNIAWHPQVLIREGRVCLFERPLSPRRSWNE
tara:strand:+ start:224 stop:658 length:435 start_codon:yes stop_codon:yes gene_type:complete